MIFVKTKRLWYLLDLSWVWVSYVSTDPHLAELKCLYFHNYIFRFFSLWWTLHFFLYRTCDFLRAYLPMEKDDHMYELDRLVRMRLGLGPDNVLPWSCLINMKSFHKKLQMCCGSTSYEKYCDVTRMLWNHRPRSFVPLRITFRESEQSPTTLDVILLAHKCSNNVTGNLEDGW